MTKWVIPDIASSVTDTVTISRERHKELFRNEMLLEALKECGVEHMLVYELALKKLAANESMLDDACERHG
jgi:hypothetical protein